MGVAQSDRQTSIRAVTGTAWTYEGDWHALWDLKGIPKGTFDERMLAWINQNLGTSLTEINGAMQALANANGAFNFSSMGMFNAGGVVPAYAPDAISIPPDTFLKAAQLGVTDTPYITMAAWVRGTNGSPANVNGTSWSIVNRDVFSNLGPAANSEVVAGFNYGSDTQGATYSTTRINLNDSTTGTNHSFQGVLSNGWGPLSGKWHHHLLFVDLSRVGDRRIALYIDGVKQTALASGDQGTIPVALNVNLNSVLGFGMAMNCGNGGPSAFDVSQFFLDNHTTGLLDASSNVSPATLAKFYNAGPVDYGTNAVTPLGTQPEKFHNGNATTFLVDQGTCAKNFVPTIQPTADAATTPKIYRAADGPAGAFDAAPRMLWQANGNSGGATSVVITNAGLPIAVGDRLVAIVQGCDSSGSTVRTLNTPAGWTAASGSFPFNMPGSGGYNFNGHVITHVAGAGDVTASGADWTPPTLTFDTAPTRSISWTLVNMGPCAVQAVAYTPYVANQTAPVLPAVTATTAAARLLGIVGVYDVRDGNTNGRGTPPTAQQLRMQNMTPASSFSPLGYQLVSDEPILTTGTTGPRTASTPGNIPTYAISMLFQ